MHIITFDSVFIPGDVPSSKNSKQWTGKFLVNSKAVAKYQKHYGSYYSDPNMRDKFKSFWNGTHEMKPYGIGFFFLRKTRREFDYTNMAQYPMDLMVKNGWIDDDNCNQVIPVFLGYKHEPKNPGVRIYRVRWVNKERTMDYYYDCHRAETEPLSPVIGKIGEKRNYEPGGSHFSTII